MRLLYVAHEPKLPSGGLRVIYSHVEKLARNGIPAFVLQNGSDPSALWFSSQAPVLELRQNPAIHASDIIILPEDYHGALQFFQSTSNQKVLFCQSFMCAFDGLRAHASYRDLGISRAFACSQRVAAFMQESMGFSTVPVVHNAIDTDLFRPLDKKIQIAFLPRRRPLEIQFIRQLFARLYPQWAQVPWIAMETSREEEVARLLGESAIFLALSRFEGFGLPPLEAMACGCLVVGFGGGAEYLSADNGFWFRDEEVASIPRCLGEILERLRQPDTALEAVRRRALETAALYSPQRQEREIVEFWARSTAALG